ncbi:MAG: DUF1599 domain-containing protein [Thermoguttaceae bacterium]|nr:DUF1599 domain-containing protein [Thermoguttaceae bacterium]
MTSANKQKPQKTKDWTDVLKEEPVDNSRQAIEDVFENLHDLIIRKNTDYGNSAFDPPVLNPNATAENAILTRLSDKFSRLRHILQKGALVADETVEDTIKDIAGYCVLFIANRKKEKMDNE